MRKTLHYYWGFGLLSCVLACAGNGESTEPATSDDDTAAVSDDGTGQTAAPSEESTTVTADSTAQGVPSDATAAGTDVGTATSKNIGILPFESLEIDEVSITGFSPQDAADALAGEHSAVLRYQNVSSDAGTHDSELVVNVKPSFEALGGGPSYNFGEEIAVVVPLSEPEIWFTANITLQTSDGTFDENATGIVRARSLDEGYVSVLVKLAEVEGSYESNPPQDSKRPIGDGSLHFFIYVMSDGTTEGHVMDEDMIGSDQSAVVARWGTTE